MSEASDVHAIRLPWNLGVAAALAAGWFLLAQSLRLFELWPGASAWYPPAALVAAACIVWGGRAVLPLFAGALLVQLLRGPGEALWRFVIASIALKCAYWIGAIVLRKLRFDPAFSRPSDLGRFALAMTLSSTLAGIVGVGNAWLGRDIAPGNVARALLVFCVGDLVAVVSLTPALLLGARYLQRHPARIQRLHRFAWLKIILVPVTLLAAVAAAPRLGFLAYGVCFIPLGWVAVTNGISGAAVMGAALNVGAILMRGWLGPAVTDNLELQIFVASLAITGLLLGSVAGERERARSLLQESEDRYRALVEMLPDPLVVHREGRVLYANGAAARVLAKPQLVGVEITDLVAAAAVPEVRQRMASLARGVRIAQAEYQLKKQDGTGHLDAELNSVPIHFDGAPASLTVARDITSRKRLADELRHAQRLESVGRLAGGIAHDFNNLLSVIITCSELLIEDLPAQSPERGNAVEIMEAARRGAALTSQLLTFSRKKPVRLEALALDAAVCGAESLLRRLIGSGVQIRFECHSGATVLADRGQLEQVVVNLAVNARDAMPDGGELSVRTAVERIQAAHARWPGLAAGDYGTLLVRDTGTGMTDAVRAQIFDPFFTTKEPGKGTGLGLATVHGIVKQAGGSIFVESEPGRGSLFAIFFPLVAADGPAKATA